MKLTQLRRLAADAADRHESGEPGAAADFRAWCLANVATLADAMAQGADPIRAKLDDTTEDTCARVVFGWTKDKTTRTAVRAQANRVTSSEVDVASAKLAATVAVAYPGAWALDAVALVALAKAVGRSGHVAFTFDGGDKPVIVSARCILDAARVTPPSRWRVQVREPLFAPGPCTLAMATVQRLAGASAAYEHAEQLQDHASCLVISCGGRRGYRLHSGALNVADVVRDGGACVPLASEARSTVDAAAE